MEIKEINNQGVWDKFLEQIEKQEKTFLQSWQWGEFQLLLKEKIWRLGFYENSALMAVCLVIKVKAKRGNFLLIPHGPLINQKSKIKNQNDKLKFKNVLIQKLTEHLKVRAKQEKCCFLRVATTWERNQESQDIFKSLGFKQAPFHTHPELTWLLDISQTEENLLKEMRKTTRYLIKQGEKLPDLKIEKSTLKKDVTVFNQIYQETAQRQGFTPFSLDYLEKELAAFLPENIIILKAIWQNKVLSAAFIIFWQGIGFYHQGASSHQESKVPATYLMQWQAIKEAKKKGCTLYNFWGIMEINQKSKIKSQKHRLKIKNEKADNNLTKHPWYGLSLFKMGFGGYTKEYLKTQDLPFSLRYYLIRYFEFLRKIKRRL